MSVQSKLVALVVGAGVGKDHSIADLQAIAHLDQVDRTSAQLHRHAAGHVVGIHLEQADFRFRLTECRAPDIQHVGQALDLDYGGLDFSILEDGRVLVFETNATMLVHPEDPAGEFASTLARNTGR